MKSRLVERAKVLCPLRAGLSGRDIITRNVIPDVPVPDRWDWRSEMAPIPEASDFEVPGLAVHSVINHHRIAQNLPWLAWDAGDLYRLAAQYERRPPLSEDEWPQLVTLDSIIEVARSHGLGDPVGVFAPAAPATEVRITGSTRLASIMEIERAIRFCGPVIIAFDWYNEWRDPRYGPLLNLIHTPFLGDDTDDDEEEEEKPEHARACLVAFGYERRRNRLKCRSAFGQGYGRRGDVDFSYHEIERQLRHGRLDVALLTVNNVGE